MQLVLVLHPEGAAHGVEQPGEGVTQGGGDIVAGVQAHTALTDHHWRIGHAAHHRALNRQGGPQGVDGHAGHHRHHGGLFQLGGGQGTECLAGHGGLDGHDHQIVPGGWQVRGLTVDAGLHVLGTQWIHGVDAIHEAGSQPGFTQGRAHAAVPEKESVQTHA